MSAAEQPQPKKPPSSYFLFAMGQREQGSKLKTGEIAAQWKALGEDQKRPYEEKARAAKAIYKEQLEAFVQNGGVLAKRAPRGTRKARGKKGAEQVQGSQALEDIPDEAILAEFSRRVAKSDFRELFCQRLIGEQPEPKRAKTLAAMCTEPGDSSETTKVPTEEDIAVAYDATLSGIKFGEAEGFKLWIEARWERLSEEAASAKPRKIGALGKEKWDKLSDAKKRKWIDGARTRVS